MGDVGGAKLEPSSSPVRYGSVEATPTAIIETSLSDEVHNASITHYVSITYCTIHLFVYHSSIRNHKKLLQVILKMRGRVH